MNSLEILLLGAQIQTDLPADPLINSTGEDLIYIGLGGIAILLILIVGVLGRGLTRTILVALVVSAVLSLLVTAT